MMDQLIDVELATIQGMLLVLIGHHKEWNWMEALGWLLVLTAFVVKIFTKYVG